MKSGILRRRVEFSEIYGLELKEASLSIEKGGQSRLLLGVGDDFGAFLNRYEIGIPNFNESHDEYEWAPILRVFSESICGIVEGEAIGLQALTGKYGPQARLEVPEIGEIQEKWRDLKWNFSFGTAADFIGYKILRAELRRPTESDNVKLHLYFNDDDILRTVDRPDEEEGVAGKVVWKYFKQLVIEFGSSSKDIWICEEVKDEEWVKELK